jgi:hypothetical protein
VIPVDAHHAFAIVGTYDRADVYRVDLDHPERSKPVASCMGQSFQYEPSTRVAAWHDGLALHLAHVDRDGALSEPGSLEGDRSTGVVLLDAARAGGAIAVAIDTSQRSSIFTPIDGFTEGGDIQLGNARESNDATWYAQLERGDYTPLGFGPPPPATSPDGALTAELAGARLTLRDHGIVRWTVAHAGVRDVVWSGDDLIAVGDGLARVDLATGALAERQSGWGFGLHDQPGPAASTPIADEP